MRSIDEAIESSRYTSVSIESGRRSFTVPDIHADLGASSSGVVRSTCSSPSGDDLHMSCTMT